MLVVDDDELVCWALEKELSSRGLTVDTIDNGRDALSRVRESLHPLVFLELQLQDLDGLGLIEPIREASPETRIVVLGCEPRPEEKRLAFERGAWQVIDKPFELSDVIALVNSTFGDYSEKRHHERYLCRLPLRVCVLSHGLDEAALDLRNLAGTTVDVGPGGLRLHTGYPLHVGQRVRASLIERDDPCAKFVPARAAAEVVWVGPARRGYTAGLRYLSEATPDRIS